MNPDSLWVIRFSNMEAFEIFEFHDVKFLSLMTGAVNPAHTLTTLNKVKAMDLILTEPTRIDKLKAWMGMHHITQAKLAAYLGMCVQRVCKDVVNSDAVPSRRVEQLRILGVPEELLPQARDRRPGRKPGLRPGPSDASHPIRS